MIRAGSIHKGEIKPVPMIIAVMIVPEALRKNNNDLNDLFIVIVLVYLHVYYL